MNRQAHNTNQWW